MTLGELNKFQKFCHNRMVDMKITIMQKNNGINLKTIL
jgi:hypothetical protein